MSFSSSSFVDKIISSIVFQLQAGWHIISVLNGEWDWLKLILLIHYSLAPSHFGYIYLWNLYSAPSGSYSEALQGPGQNVGLNQTIKLLALLLNHVLQCGRFLELDLFTLHQNVSCCCSLDSWAYLQIKKTISLCLALRVEHISTKPPTCPSNIILFRLFQIFLIIWLAYHLKLLFMYEIDNTSSQLGRLHNIDNPYLQ